MGPTDDTFGDPGMGGAVGYADPVRELSFAFIPNRMVFSPGRPIHASTRSAARRSTLWI